LSNVRVDVYKVVSRAVEEGIEFGWNRAHKHNDKPTPDAIKNAVYDAIMHELSDLILFGDNNE
jgi:hypothetical protein